jgi:hypothetical protein
MDEFWEIAMEQQERVESSDDDDDNTEPSRRMRYKLPKHTNTNTTTTTLELQPLAAKDGIWIPLGADAWYASALLATMFFQYQQDDKAESSIILTTSLLASNGRRSSPIKILEIGSGAVGLSGLACAAALRTNDDIQMPWTLTMTDNDPAVLRQLKDNVQHNLPKLDLNDTNNKIHVESLDWNDDNVSTSHTTITRDVDLVIGSELVYSDETATACTKLLLRLLRDNPDIRIWIVQVIDRWGWLDIVLPALEAQGATVTSVPISFQVHEMACTMIPMGGTLDRHAYGAFSISNNNNNNNNNNKR